MEPSDQGVHRAAQCMAMMGKSGKTGCIQKHGMETDHTKSKFKRGKWPPRDVDRSVADLFSGPDYPYRFNLSYNRADHVVHRGNLMPDRFVETHIQQLPLFARLPLDQLRWAMDAFRMMRFEPGEMVFAQGEPTQGLYMFVSGRALLVRTDAQGRQQQIGVIGPNQYLNETALFRPGIETASLQVVETANVLYVGRKQLMTVIAHHPEMQKFIPIPVAVQQAQKQEMAFKGQRPNETVLLDTRRHWWAFVRKAWFPGVVAGALLVIAGLMTSAFLQLCLGGLAIVLPGLLMLYFYLEWRNDHIIITNQRLIHIEQTIHTMETSISEVNMDSIHQVNADIVTSDLFSRVFGYGTVSLRTAGEAGNIYLTVIPDPDGIQDLVLQTRVQGEQAEQREHHQEIRAEIDRVLSGQGGVAPAVERTTPAETVYRKHPMVWIRNLFIPGLLMVFSIVFFLLTLTVSALDGLGLLGPLIAFLFFLLGGVGFYWAYWDWRNDIYLVGEDIIRLIHRRPLFLQNEDDQLLLESVDNVVSERKGLFQSLLNYGNVRISLIGGDVGDSKTFYGVPHPQEVQEEITRRQARVRNRGKEDAERQRKGEIAEYLKVYHETVGGEQAGAQPQPQQPYTQQTPPPQPRAPQDRMRPPGIPKPRGDN